MPTASSPHPSTTAPQATGLEGVLAADTRLSHIDGEAGQLLIAGLPVVAAARAGFAATLGAIRRQRPPGGTLATGAAAIEAELGRARRLAHDLLRAQDLKDLEDLATAPDAMLVLRQALARGLPEGAPDTSASALFAVWLGAWTQRARGADPRTPDPDASHAADLLRLLRGEDASVAEARALDAYLATVVDHGLNASTFAARVVASTGADDVSALLAALGALSGPLHGGAPGPVLDMLDAIGEPARARAWIEAELDAGRRIMGLGHRVYRVRDPRAAALEDAVMHLRSPRLALARHVEKVAVEVLAERKSGRSLRANVELWTAVLLDALGLDRRAFTAVFAISRVAGWAAHAAEQRAYGRLIRPRSRYVGPTPPA